MPPADLRREACPKANIEGENAMKRLVMLLLTLCLVVPLVSCEDSNPPIESQPPDQAQVTPPVTLPAENGQDDIDDKEEPEDSLVE